MKKLIPLCLLGLGLAGLSLPGRAAEQKIATFDFRKAFDNYYKTIQSRAALNQEGADLDKQKDQMIQAAQKVDDERLRLVEKANDQSLSAEEREKNKKAVAAKEAELENDKQYLTKFVHESNTRLDEKKRIQRDKLVEEIMGAVKAHAKAGGYALALDSSGDSANMVPVVLYTNGQDDMTESILKELNAGAPPGSLDTNAPAARSGP